MKVALQVVGWVDCWFFFIFYLFIYLISVTEINKPQNQDLIMQKDIWQVFICGAEKVRQKIWTPRAAPSKTFKHGPLAHL